MVKRLIRQSFHYVKGWLQEPDPDELTDAAAPFNNKYPWLRARFREVMRDEQCARRPSYLWGVLQGAALAKVLAVPRISVLEFGGAGGAGLLALERAAERAKELTGVR